MIGRGGERERERAGEMERESKRERKRRRGRERGGYVPSFSSTAVFISGSDRTGSNLYSDWGKGEERGRGGERGEGRRGGGQYNGRER